MAIQVEVGLQTRRTDRANPGLGQAGWRAVRQFRGRLNLVVGSVLIGGLLLTALLAPLLAPFAPDQINPLVRLQAPSLTHLFGTDNLGRDLLSRVVYGARTALQMALPAVALAATVGVSLGLLAGYYGGLLDQILSRLADAWLAFPGLLLAIVLVARMGPSLTTTVFALGVMGIPGYYRMTRNGTRSARHNLYVEAAQALGLCDRRILLRHILPNLASPLIVLATLRLGTVILAGGALSFIGLGAQPPTPEWGSLLAAGRDYMGRAWWLALFPGMAITATVMGFNLLGDGLRDALAPEMARVSDRSNDAAPKTQRRNA